MENAIARKAVSRMKLPSIFIRWGNPDPYYMPIDLAMSHRLQTLHAWELLGRAGIFVLRQDQGTS